MIYIGLNGACGKMGRSIALNILRCDNYAITHVFDTKESKCFAKDYGEICNIDPWKIYVKELNIDIEYDIDVLIDFSSSIGLSNALEYCYKHKKALISGTTNIDEKTIKKMKLYSKKIPIVYSTNMSEGINQIMRILELLTQTLNNKNNDIEIIEYHHNQKKDAPSGTALTIANRIAKITSRKVNKTFNVKFPRTDEIRIHSLRMSNIPGTHSIIISSDSETIEIKHTAHSREAFSKGVLKAIDFIVSKRKGLYSMTDVLGG